MTNEEMIVKLEEDGLSTLSDMEFITNALQENTKLKAEIEQLKENYDTLAKQYSNVENSSIKYYNELKQLKSELKQSVKIPERRRERKTEEYEFGVLGKGFDTGWNSCLDMFESLKGANNGN